MSRPESSSAEAFTPATPPPPSMLFGEFRLDRTTRRLLERTSGVEVPLSPRAFDLLMLLLSPPGRLVTRGEIHQALWPGVVVEDNNIDQTLSALRRALRETRGGQRCIQTVHRRGYRFVGEVETPSPPLPALPASAPAAEAMRAAASDPKPGVRGSPGSSAPRRTWPGAWVLAPALAIPAVALAAWLVTRLITPAPAPGAGTPGAEGTVATPSRVPRAQELYVLARYHREQRVDVASLQQALALFSEAAALDPGFAAAHLGVAEMHMILAVFGAVSPQEGFPLARVALNRAIALDPHSPAVLVALGHLKTQFEHDWHGAGEAYRSALQREPDNVSAHQFHGLWLAYSGRFDEAIASMRRAAMLAPTVPVYRALVGMLLNYQRRYPEAHRELQAALLMDERQATTRSYLAMTLARLGQYQAALALVDAVRSPAPGNQGYRGQILALAGERAAARAEAQALIARRAQAHVAAYDIATIFATLGEREPAMQWLQRGLAERSATVAFVPWDPAFDGLRDDPRYKEVARTLAWQGDTAPAAPQ